jgi:hypothetical protein
VPPRLTEKEAAHELALRRRYPEDLIGVLIAIRPQVGGPRAVAAAPELMVALGLSLPDGV